MKLIQIAVNACGIGLLVALHLAQAMIFNLLYALVRFVLVDYCLIFGVRHLEIVLREFFGHYHRARPHQGIRQLTPISLLDPPLAPVQLNRIVRIDRLGGLIHEYG